MKKHSIGSIIITKADEPEGIVTERDILYKVVARGKDPVKTLLGNIMSAPLISVPAGTTVQKALATMFKHNFRRLLVRDGKKVVGIISQRTCVGDVRKHDTSLAEIELPKGVKCPHCNFVLPDRDAVFRHMDRVHFKMFEKRPHRRQAY